uniref:THAP domain-containing protein 1 n=1 Tax=Sinocyclocheilus rhinocerous TaxID=307959 RepID=A0A673MQK4_9TELE
MVVRCIFGCTSPQVLFAIPKEPSRRARWLEFLHFEEGGINANSRLCARHFTEDCFKNLKRYEMGLVQILHLSDTAVPSVYTVGVSMNVKPLTRDVGCQCAPKTVRNTGVQVAFSTPKPKRRSKAVQVKSWGPSLSCSTADLGTMYDPPYLTSTLIKRPRMENSGTIEINDTSSGNVTIKESTMFDS